ncbi:MAG: metalloprotease [Bacteroidota bacterium]
MNKLIFVVVSLAFFCSTQSYSQHKISADVTVEDNGKIFHVKQTINYKNTTGKDINEIWFYDWLNAFSDKKSPLGKRYAQEYTRKFHFASAKERGGTFGLSINTKESIIQWKRPKNQPDLIQVKLDQPLKKGESIALDFSYTLDIPIASFTGYGYTEEHINLKYWLILPAVHHQDWIIYSHKELFDLPKQLNDYSIKISVPSDYFINSTFETQELRPKSPKRKKYLLKGKNHSQIDLVLSHSDSFDVTITDFGTIQTNLSSDNLNSGIKSLIADRAMNYLTERLGDYPHQKILISEADYMQSPVYGLNQLPDFIRPFPDGFQYDIKLFKTLTAEYLKNSIFINNREDQWLLDAFQIALMADYVDAFYPNTKMLGTLSNFIGIHWTHAAELEFNDRYHFLLQTMIQQNIDQPLATPQDSLMRFNKKIANPYKGGIGINYLKSYLGPGVVEKSIQTYYKNFKLKPSNPSHFQSVLETNTEKSTDWFFGDFATNNHFIDFKISKAKKVNDSIDVIIKNKYSSKLPVAIYQLKDEEVIAIDWVDEFQHSTEVTIKDHGADRIAVNYEQLAPEINPRNNFKSVNTLFNKPFQLRLLEDIDDPTKEQLFVIPEFAYNLYDGIFVGSKFYNTSLLPKQFSYKIAPKYGTKSNALIGNIAIDYTSYFKNSSLFAIRYGLGGSRFSYDTDLFYNRYSGFLTFAYRPKDYRNNKRQFLTLRNISVHRDESESTAFNMPDYDIFNINYKYQNKNLDRFFTAEIDYQISKNFGKIAATTTFRKLFANNRQINLRFFGGLFIFNDYTESDYFSFALDRPTDYMFDYNYYGRSEQSGLFSQQFIMAEGGFKSMLEPAFANQWITTGNMSTTIWNWIFAYGDVGLVKSKGQEAKFLYDSGLRLNLVEDYFELFLPVYSSQGWEVGRDSYGERIRFIVTLDIPTLFNLFTRKWY